MFIHFIKVQIYENIFVFTYKLGGYHLNTGINLGVTLAKIEGEL